MTSLAQGIVFWTPPPAALADAMAFAAASPERVSAYCEDAGLPALRAALRDKLAHENGLSSSTVMVTAGANQAFTNVVLSLCDSGDRVALFAPYYFNHKMALQMTGCKIVNGARDPATMLPSAAWVEQTLADPSTSLKMVVVTNPCNPSGVVVPKRALERIAVACARAGCWLVLDNTYEYFVYGEHRHHAIEAPHVINIFSFSKAYGMMGWRMGYIAFQDVHQHQEVVIVGDGGEGGGGETTTTTTTWSLQAELLKVQDTIPICPTILSQHVAMGALRAGRAWVDTKLGAVVENQQMIRAALVGALGEENVKGGQGAIYLFAKLPVADDVAFVRALAADHGIVVIPGTSCGAPGHIRVSYANLRPEACKTAAARLREGLAVLVG
jgi:aspartate/methionine/tyrosine aminotransferase